MSLFSKRPIIIPLSISLFLFVRFISSCIKDPGPTEYACNMEFTDSANSVKYDTLSTLRNIVLDFHLNIKWTDSSITCDSPDGDCSNWPLESLLKLYSARGIFSGKDTIKPTVNLLSDSIINRIGRMDYSHIILHFNDSTKFPPGRNTLYMEYSYIRDTLLFYYR